MDDQNDGAEYSREPSVECIVISTENRSRRPRRKAECDDEGSFLCAVAKLSGMKNSHENPLLGGVAR